MSQPFKFRVDAAEAGRRLDEFLAGRLSRLSRIRIAGLLAGGAGAVNGAAAGAGWRLREGDAVEISLADEGPNSTTPEALPLEVVYEDEHLVVVVKPSGMLVHPTRGVKSGTLANALTYHLNRLRVDESNAVSPSAAGNAASAIDDSSAIGNSDAVVNPPSSNPRPATRDPQFIRPGIVHRLDRETSGLMVVAKTQTALSRLSRHFHRRLVEKRYLAVVGGRVVEDERTIAAPIGREDGAQPQWRVREGGKHSETRLRVLERRGARTLVELEPVTGRTNQLRIHCAHVGHAVVGDCWYGGEAHARLCLHAARLAFRHPASNEWVEFRSPLPKEIGSALEAAPESAGAAQR